jgi:DNA-binding response OmpR family regulator
MRILVVDDNQYVATSFAEILTIQGHSVDIAATGREALRLTETREYAVVLTDMRMPDIDGPSLYRQVSARDSLLAKSFLFVTGDVFSEENHQFLTETSAVYLSKPCTFAEVESAVAQVMRRRADQCPESEIQEQNDDPDRDRRRSCDRSQGAATADR